jgi:dienelactone hydrolase
MGSLYPLLAGSLAFASIATAAVRTLTGLSIPQQGASTPLNAVLYAPDTAVWTAPYPVISMLPGGGADIDSVAWAAQLLARDGYMVVITKPQSGGSAASYNTAAKSGIDYLLSPANPFLAEADTSRVGACGWSLGARALARTQEEDTRVDCIVAWDNLAISENGDEGSPSGGGTGTPVRVPRVPALGQASEMPGVDAQSKLTAWEHWRAHYVPCAEIVFATGTTTAAHLKWGTAGSTSDHDLFHHYTRAWFDRWLKNDRMGVERLLVDTLDGVNAPAFLSTLFTGGLYADGYDSADLRTLVTSSATARAFAPNLAEPAITTFNNAHHAYLNSAATARGRLFLFLPGTGALPFQYRQVLRCAADHGFHALGLMYVNSPSVGELTLTEPSDAAGKVRLEIIDGTDRTSLVNVNRANSIENRLVTALQYLQTRAPEENWARFLDAGNLIRWDRIIVSGHSQGGGHAAVISKVNACNRVLVFNASDWSSTADRPADWMSNPSATPVERVYGIGHMRDPLVIPSQIRLGWEALGLPRFGAEQPPESQAYPFGYTHQFMTDIDPSDTSSPQSFHGADIVDARVPLDAHGLPVMRPFWAHLMLSSQTDPQAGIGSGVVTISTTDGVLYQLQTSADLRVWINQGTPFAGDGGVLSAPVTPSGAVRFWRWLVIE